MTWSEKQTFRTKLGLEKVFRVHELLWWLLGQKPGRYHGFYRWIYYLYSAIINIFVGIGCPLHLAAGFFLMDSMDDKVASMRVTLRAALCTIKSFTIWWKLKNFKEIEELMQRLDERIEEPEDIMYMKDTVYSASRRVRNVIGSFFIAELFFGMSLSIVITVINEKTLPFPAYFIFDPYKSIFTYVVAHLYQDVVGFTHAFQAIIVDTYATMCLGIMAGHVHVLGRRVSRIGSVNSKTLRQNNVELVDCIKDHNLLLRFHNKFIELFSGCLFSQVLLTAVNISINCFYIMFFVKDPFNLIFSIANLLIIPIEIFPSCFYCTKLEIEFENLSSEIYKCNWMDQNREFKDNIRIFVEQTLRPVIVKAGGMVPVDLPMFLATCKMAYTILTVLIQIK